MKQNEQKKKFDSRQLKVESEDTEFTTEIAEHKEFGKENTTASSRNEIVVHVEPRLKKNAGKMPALPAARCFSGRRVFDVVRSSGRLEVLRWTRLLRWRARRRVSVSPWRHRDFLRAARVLWCRGWEPSTVSAQGSTRERFARSSRFSLSRIG